MQPANVLWFVLLYRAIDVTFRSLYEHISLYLFMYVSIRSYIYIYLSLDLHIYLHICIDKCVYICRLEDMFAIQTSWTKKVIQSLTA